METGLDHFQNDVVLMNDNILKTELLYFWPFGLMRTGN